MSTNWQEYKLPYKNLLNIHVRIENESNYFVQREGSGGRFKPIATGTGFISLLTIRGNIPVFVIVSNKHVLGDPIDNLGKVPGNISIRGHTITPDIGVPVPHPEARYFVHPDPKIDLACLVVTDILQNEDKTVAEMMLTNNYYNLPSSVAVDTDLVFWGYPAGIGDSSNNLPLKRKASLATLIETDYNGKPQIVIDAPVYPGSSGSPVFIKTGRDSSTPLQLLGVLSETFYIKGSSVISDKIESAFTEGNRHYLNFGIIIKTRCVTELLNHVAKHAAMISESDSFEAYENILQSQHGEPR